MKNLSASLSSAIALTALESLKNGLSRDKADRHAFIVSHTATVIALAMVHTAPKGIGNPADWAKLPAMFEASGLKGYADHCAAFKQALKGRARKVADWSTAQEEAADVVLAAFAPLAPRTLTPEQVAKREADKAAKKAEREKGAKAAEKAAKVAQAEGLKAARQAAFDEGRASVVITATDIATMLRAGSFSAADIATIRAAMPDVTTVAAVTTITA